MDKEFLGGTDMGKKVENVTLKMVHVFIIIEIIRSQIIHKDQSIDKLGTTQNIVVIMLIISLI
jgi:hypothetical protein